MSGPRVLVPSTAVMTKEAFAEWLRCFTAPESLETHKRIWGKPRVRVPVERQTPNEADL